MFCIILAHFLPIVIHIRKSRHFFSQQVVYQKMQNFKGFQNLDKFFWDSMTSRGYSQYTSSRIKTPLPL